MIDLLIEEEKKKTSGAHLKVIGIGGGGGNAVNSMIASADMDVVSFIAANTDAQSLNLSSATTKIQIGNKVTKGLGAGSNPEVGRRAAEENLEDIITNIEDADILFLTAGLGGGTGSGALPVIARTAKEMDILTVAIVTKPFLFEGKRRESIANDAIEDLKNIVDTLIVIPNQRLLEVADAKISMLDAFSLANSILKQAIKGITDIITKSGHINVDFADVKTIMKDMGMALMGTGRASGEHRAKQAAEQAINSPLLSDISIQGAQGVLINITGNTDLGLYEINEAASMVYDLVSKDANIILGSVIDQEMDDEVMVTVIATGFDNSNHEHIKPAPAPYAHTKHREHSFGTVQKNSSQESSVQIREKREDTFEQEKKQASYKGLDTEKTITMPPLSSTPKPTQENHTQITAATKNYEQKTTSQPTQQYECDLNNLDTPTFLRKKAELKQAWQGKNIIDQTKDRIHKEKNNTNQSYEKQPVLSNQDKQKDAEHQKPHEVRNKGIISL